MAKPVTAWQCEHCGRTFSVKQNADECCELAVMDYRTEWDAFKKFISTAYGYAKGVDNRDYVVYEILLQRMQTVEDKWKELRGGDI